MYWTVTDCFVVHSSAIEARPALCQDSVRITT